MGYKHNKYDEFMIKYELCTYMYVTYVPLRQREAYVATGDFPLEAENQIRMGLLGRILVFIVNRCIYPSFIS